MKNIRSLTGKQNESLLTVTRPRISSYMIQVFVIIS
jgi:hypothetical protein